MKKATFIITICTLTFAITGCGGKDSQSALTLDEFYAESEVLQTQLSNIEAEIGEQSAFINEQLADIIENQSNMLVTQPAVSKQPQLAPESSPEPTEKPKPEESTNTAIPLVSAVYNNELLSIPITDSATAVTPFKLTWPGYRNRDLTIIIYGSISHINWVDENGGYISTLSFQTANGINYATFEMVNDGTGANFYFELVTTDKNRKYFGVDYH